MELDLSKIRTDVPNARNKKGKVKPYSNEDKHMIGGVQPASRTKFCSNDYSLTTKVSYDVCCNCCDNLPDGSLPMTIVPLVNPECFGFQPPNGWAPMDCGNYNVRCQYADKIDVDVEHTEKSSRDPNGSHSD